MDAVTGKLLSVDLNKGACIAEELPQDLYREYLGGYGLGVKLLLERMDPACDPLGPGNILGFAAGYLTGTGAYIASRFMVFGKSPSTLGWGDANCGGHFGGMAFVRRADNSFGLVVDNMDGRRLAEHLGWPAGTHEQFAQRFAQEFALRTVQTKMAEQGYTLDVQRADDGTLKITASSAVSSYGTNPSSGGYSL